MLTNLIARKSPWWTGLHKFNLPSFCGLVTTELSGRFSVFKIQHHVCATKRQANEHETFVVDYKLDRVQGRESCWGTLINFMVVNSQNVTYN